MQRANSQRLLREQVIEGSTVVRSDRPGSARSGRSVTVNLAESPLGWLLARGLVSRRQFDAGERLRADWERAQLPPRVTVAWDAAPVARGRGGTTVGPDLGGSQINAKKRFDAAIAAAGPGLADMLWRLVCACAGSGNFVHALATASRAGGGIPEARPLHRRS